VTAVVDAAVDRVDLVGWAGVEASLDVQGFAKLPPILDRAECDALAALYSQDAPFRSRIDMSRFRFGVGEYKYFQNPLPPLVQTLRETLYTRLVSTANRWTDRLHKYEVRSSRYEYPSTLDAFLSRCHGAAQRRPTPLLLSYSAGGYNCLHQDIYGDVAFPLQVVFALSRVDSDYTGGEFLLVEQRPRAQSRGHAVRIEQGEGVVFATRERPVAGARGDYRVAMRHGVSTVTGGSRMTLGIIFHDAR
jgi:uncharacterized protein